jgi:quinoprotein glucose dehydrogenase
LNEALKIAQADKSESLRKEASRFLGQGDAADAVAALTTTLERGAIGERQAAMQALGKIKGKDADRVISKWMDQLLANTAPKEMQLDVLEAAGLRSSPSIKEKIKKYEEARDKNDPLAKFKETMFGGDAKAGRQIFFERAEVGCFRCHKISGEGGEVGPDLTGILAKHDRQYLLESIVLPNKQIAPGFESLVVTMKTGVAYAGVSKGEDANELTLNSPEDGILKLKKAEIKSTSKSLSPMPENLPEVLTRRELRDLIEFVSTAK